MMKKTLLFAIAFTLTFAIACKSDKKEQEIEAEEIIENETTESNEATSTGGRDGSSIWVVLESKSGSNAKGNVVFEQENENVTMVAALTGLDAGVYDLQLRESSDCSADDGTSSGDLWGLTEKNGNSNIGNFTVYENGKGTLTFTTDQWCIGCEDAAKNIVGKGIVIFNSEAGSILACGGIIE